MTHHRLITGMIVILVISLSSSLLQAKQETLSESALLKMAGDKYASGELPLGDQRYTLDAPRKGSIFLCHKFDNPMGGGAQRAGDWIHGSTWNLKQKPTVMGEVNWSDAFFGMSINGDERILVGNGHPVNTTTGFFPVKPFDPAYLYDRNPNAIKGEPFRQILPLNPRYSDPPACMGMEVGFMLNGVPLFNGFDASLRDAAAHEIQDSCAGHPQKSGLYHYHSLSPCIKDISQTTVIGFALDGFPITGPMVSNDTYLTTADLDTCHGITSKIEQDGQWVVTYHYVMTFDFPYSVSCFRGTPVRTGPLQPPIDLMKGNGTQSDVPPPPPEEAITACIRKKAGDACGFMAPSGTQITGTCRAPRQTDLACIPLGAFRHRP